MCWFVGIEPCGEAGAAPAQVARLPLEERPQDEDRKAVELEHNAIRGFALPFTEPARTRRMASFAATSRRGSAEAALWAGSSFRSCGTRATSRSMDRS
jgi:hypothetical protein